MVDNSSWALNFRSFHSKKKRKKLTRNPVTSRNLQYELNKFVLSVRRHQRMFKLIHHHPLWVDFHFACATTASSLTQKREAWFPWRRARLCGSWPWPAVVEWRTQASTPQSFLPADQAAYNEVSFTRPPSPSDTNLLRPLKTDQFQKCHSAHILLFGKSYNPNENLDLNKL